MVNTVGEIAWSGIRNVKTFRRYGKNVFSGVSAKRKKITLIKGTVGRMKGGL